MTAPRVRRVPAAGAKTAPPAERLVVPKVTPAVPLVTLVPTVMFSVCAPMDRVPRV